MSGIDITSAPVSTITIPDHRGRHQDAGEDEISLAGLSGEPADVVNKTLFDANTILKADADNTPAALTVAEQRLVGRITAGVIAALTAAQVRTLLNVADGADVTGSNAPQAHKASHQDAGADEISVAGLAGDLADAQDAKAHAASHQDAGADEISVAGLSGLLADDQHVLDAEVLAVAASLTHAADHVGVGDQIDGDQLDIDFTPTNYTPDAAPAEAADVDDLSAHLKGIDTVLAGPFGAGVLEVQVFS